MKCQQRFGEAVALSLPKTFAGNLLTGHPYDPSDTRLNHMGDCDDFGGVLFYSVSNVEM